MPTVIAHAVVGACLGSLAPRQVPLGRLILVLAILPVVPDLDVIGFSFGIPYGDPLGHRGFTHSILFAAAAAVFVKALLFRDVATRSRAGAAVLTLCFVATLSHGLLDALTDAGLGVGFFIPFDNGRYFFPWRPIATSPLSIDAFLSHHGLSILANESMWVGIQVAIFTGLVYLGKRIARRTDS